MKQFWYNLERLELSVNIFLTISSRIMKYQVKRKTLFKFSIHYERCTFIYQIIYVKEMFTTHKNWPPACGYCALLVMSQKPVKAFLQIPRVRMECGIGCLGYQTVHQVRISHCHGSHKYTSVYYRSAHRYQSLPSGKPYVFLLEQEMEGINCNHCMKLMSILGEIGICYTRKRTLDFLDALYFNIGEVCIHFVFSQLGHLWKREKNII